ncbi:MAG: antitoxin [Alphaproteobacteria bacterium]|jgi:antitoxin VapB|nr:antitoxin [Alphaproteobacteria bacterium]MBM3952541.1 antitoxin [Rhodospirillales bacterium]
MTKPNAHSTVFTTNKSQAVRLPKAVALPNSVKRVEIVKVGQARLIVPAGMSWDTFFDGAKVSDDFMTSRAQPAAQAREDL